MLVKPSPYRLNISADNTLSTHPQQTGSKPARPQPASLPSIAELCRNLPRNPETWSRLTLAPVLKPSSAIPQRIDGLGKRPSESSLQTGAVGGVSHRYRQVPLVNFFPNFGVRSAVISP